MLRVSRRRSFGLPLALIALASSTAAAAPERMGFAGDLSIGASVTTRTLTVVGGGTNMPSTSSSSTVLEPGLAPLGVSLGGYFTPRIALLGRLAGTSYFRGGGNTQILHTFLGPVVEFWPHDRWFLAGGVGLGTLAPNPLFGPSASSPRQGLAFDARAGAVLKGGVRHALTASLEIVPAIYNHPQVGAALLLGWKWY